MMAERLRLRPKELPESMQVQINGEARDFDGPLTVESVLQTLGFDPRKIAVERNLEIVPKGAYGGTPVADGDKLEIVHFIGGGANTATAAIQAYAPYSATVPIRPSTNPQPSRLIARARSALYNLRKISR